MYAVSRLCQDKRIINLVLKEVTVEWKGAFMLFKLHFC